MTAEPMDGERPCPELQGAGLRVSSGRRPTWLARSTCMALRGVTRAAGRGPALLGLLNEREVGVTTARPRSAVEATAAADDGRAKES
mmetsp:Transcript_74273/g.133861  ORF Transcript_74273/g.133861 Transcript_74273/m.133861 type:complete len:87 (+) Transcript_74273:762-1022(+)